MVELVSKYFDKRITMGNIITIAGGIVSILWIIATLEAATSHFDKRLAAVERKQESIDQLNRHLAEMQGDIRYLRQMVERQLRNDAGR